MVLAFRRKASMYESARLRLRGLDLEARYSVRDRDSGTAVEASGRELSGEGVLIAIPGRPGSACLEYRRS